MSEGIIDLNVIKPKEQVIEVDGKKIDVSVISFGVVLDIIDKMDELSNIEKGGRKANRKMLEIFGDIVDQILKDSDPEIDDKWIKKHISGFRRMMLIDRVVTPLLNDVTEGMKGKSAKKKVD